MNGGGGIAVYCVPMHFFGPAFIAHSRKTELRVFFAASG